MRKADKLLERLYSKPKDFTWEEMKKVLRHYGYEEIDNGKTGGSRRKFVSEDGTVISLYEPHPRNILKSYQLDIVIAHLKR